MSAETNSTHRSAAWRRWTGVLLATLLVAASGLTFCVALASHAWPRYTGPIALAAFVFGGIAWLARGASFLLGARRAQPATLAAAARWMFLILFLPLPGWLLGWGGGSHASFWTAFALQLAGLAAERWLSFAEARLAEDQARPEGA